MRQVRVRQLRDQLKKDLKRKPTKLEFKKFKKNYVKDKGQRSIN